MTEIMPVPRNLILLSYQQGASAGRFLQLVKKVSQSLPPAGGKSSAIHFLPGRVPGKKYFSVCKCGICLLPANKLCARQTASLLFKKGSALFGQSQKTSGSAGRFFSEVHGALQHPQVIGLKGDAAVFLHVHLHAGPVGVDLAVLLDENVVQNVIGHAVVPGFLNGGIG